MYNLFVILIVPDQRAQLMPAEKAMPAKEVIALLAAQDFTHQRRISFEYIMFGGLNDSRQHIMGSLEFALRNEEHVEREGALSRLVCMEISATLLTMALRTVLCT